jgi:hypothetical protein
MPRTKKRARLRQKAGLGFERDPLGFSWRFWQALLLTLWVWSWARARADAMDCPDEGGGNRRSSKQRISFEATPATREAGKSGEDLAVHSMFPGWLGAAFEDISNSVEKEKVRSTAWDHAWATKLEKEESRTRGSFRRSKAEGNSFRKNKRVTAAEAERTAFPSRFSFLHARCGSRGKMTGTRASTADGAPAARPARQSFLQQVCAPVQHGCAAIVSSLRTPATAAARDEKQRAEVRRSHSISHSRPKAA